MNEAFEQFWLELEWWHSRTRRELAKEVWEAAIAHQRRTIMAKVIRKEDVPALYKSVEVSPAIIGGVTLDLTYDEAQMLYAVLGTVGGPIEGRRGLASGIYAELYMAGICVGYSGYEDTHKRGSITFDK